MLRVVADTNIYISGLNFGGPPLQLLKLAETGQVRLIISDAILDEIGRVLWEKFSWTEERIAAVMTGLRGMAELAVPTNTVVIIVADPSDNRILECADAGQADVIVSGDNHLLQLGHYGQLPILKVADFLSRAHELWERDR